MTAQTRHLPSAEPPKIVGHRGAAGHAPENTLAGLHKAHELGVHWVEFDVMLATDGTPVLFHDDTLERTTDGTGRLTDHRWEDLRRLDAGSWFGPAFKGERIPSLHEALAVLGRTGMGANVELKPAKEQDATTGVITAKTLRESWPANLPAPLISSFSEKALGAAADQAPEFPRALLVWEFPADWQARCVAPGATALHASAKHLNRGPGPRGSGRRLRPSGLHDERSGPGRTVLRLGRRKPVFRLSRPDVRIMTALAVVPGTGRP